MNAQVVESGAETVITTIARMASKGSTGAGSKILAGSSGEIFGTAIGAIPILGSIIGGLQPVIQALGSLIHGPQEAHQTISETIAKIADHYNDILQNGYKTVAATSLWDQILLGVLMVSLAAVLLFTVTVTLFVTAKAVKKLFEWLFGLIAGGSKPGLTDSNEIIKTSVVTRDNIEENILETQPKESFTSFIDMKRILLYACVITGLVVVTFVGIFLMVAIIAIVCPSALVYMSTLISGALVNILMLLDFFSSASAATGFFGVILTCLSDVGTVVVYVITNFFSSMEFLLGLCISVGLILGTIIVFSCFPKLPDNMFYSKKQKRFVEHVSDSIVALCKCNLQVGLALVVIMIFLLVVRLICVFSGTLVSGIEEFLTYLAVHLSDWLNVAGEYTKHAADVVNTTV
ncbi:hypothetical protein NEOKW01_2088 [Nematocida sp. AWRm80]|nr:hypothetical protein NEOKW01_2088 [Nematocida sp. AWRm80]